jgi:transglutaminase-like putative cysteine protease
MRHLAVLCVIGASSACFADTTYLGLYLQGNKIGYSSYQSAPTTFDGKLVTKNDSRTVIDAGLQGDAMSVTMDSTAWTTKSGLPLRMIFDTESGGRSNKVDAMFSGNSVTLNIANGGVKTKRTLPLPSGGPVVDDPLTLVAQGALRVGATQSFFVLDPSTATFMKNTVRICGRTKTSVDGRPVVANMIRVTDDRAITNVFVNDRWDVVRVDGPMGITMLPVSKRVAMSKPGKYSPSTDLAISSSIKPDKQIDDAAELSRLSLRITSDSISTIPSDQYQTATKLQKGWRLDIHPPKLKSNPTTTVAQVAADKPEWLKPSLNIPSDSPQFKSLASHIVGTKNTVQDAAFAIQLYVYQNMRPNAGIGVLRDATEVLASKEGVCRDYATLTLTLLRAAGIPARLASGLVTWDGTFYYHAWTEAWDGTRWIGVDSTTDRAQMSASHVKLGEGNIETAFAFNFLEKAKIEVLDAHKE